MKAQRRHIGALEFINDILLARARLTQAKSDLALAKAQAQTAKRQGKENKPDARSARKQVSYAEREFTRVRAALAKIEKNYLTAVQQTVRKPLPSPLAAGEASGNKPLPSQARRPVQSAARVIKEKSRPQPSGVCSWLHHAPLAGTPGQQDQPPGHESK